MRVAYVFTDLPDQTGTFSFVELGGMASRGFDVEVVCLRDRLARGEGARLLRARFRVHEARYLSPATLWAMLRLMLRRPGPFFRALGCTVRDTWSSPVLLLKTLGVIPKCCWLASGIRRNEVDWIQAYWASLPARAAWWLSQFSGVPYGTWAHAGTDLHCRAHQTEQGLQTVLSGAELVVTCSRMNAEWLMGMAAASDSGKLFHVPHGVDTDRFCDGPERPIGSGAPPDSKARAAKGPVRLLSVGRLVEMKGYQHAIRACALLGQRGVPVHYSIVGDGPFRDRLRELVEELRCSSQIEFRGSLNQSELPPLYREAEIFLVPSVVAADSDRDALPNVLLEAMASGLPCIGSDTLGIPEVLEHDVSGLLVAPGNPVALARAVEELAADEGRRARLGREARRRVEQNYDRDRCLDQLALVLKNAIRRSRETPASARP